MATKVNTFPAYFALFKVALRQMFWSRRTVLILLGCALSLVIALIFRFAVGGRVTVNGFIPRITLILYGLLVNLCAIFYGTAIISDEIDGKGLTYLQMRPLRKPTILLSKFAAYLVGTLAIIASSHLILTGIVATHAKLDKNILFHLGMSLRYTASLAFVLANVRRTCCRISSEVQVSCPMGVAVYVWMGTYYRSAIPAGGDQETFYITLPF